MPLIERKKQKSSPEAAFEDQSLVRIGAGEEELDQKKYYVMDLIFY